MKRRAIFSGLLMSILILFITSNANAPRNWNLYWINVEQQAKEASVLILNAVSTLFRSLEALEAGFPDKRLLLWDHSFKSLEVSENLLHTIGKEIKDGSRPIDFGRVPQPQRKLVKTHFKRFKTIPKTKMQLANFAVDQVRQFRKEFQQIEFSKGLTQDELRQDRQKLLTINDRLYEFIKTGIFVSEIAAGHR